MNRACHARFAVFTLHMPPHHTLGMGDQAHNGILLARSGVCRRALMVLAYITKFMRCVQNQSTQFVPITPFQREHQRQAQFTGASEFMDDLDGEDDKGPKNVSNKAMVPNGRGSSVGSGFMSYHGGKIVSHPLSVYLIM